MVIWLLNWRMISIVSKNAGPFRCIVPKYHSYPNLGAQKGVLTYWQLRIDHDVADQLKEPVDRTPLDEKIKEEYPGYKLKEFPLIYKLMIPVTDCKEALIHVISLGYCSARLFPGYRGVIQQIDDETMLNSI